MTDISWPTHRPLRPVGWRSWRPSPCQNRVRSEESFTAIPALSRGSISLGGEFRQVLLDDLSPRLVPYRPLGIDRDRERVFPNPLSSGVIAPIVQEIPVEIVCIHSVRSVPDGFIQIFACKVSVTEADRK